MISPLVFPTFPFLRQLPQALYRYLLFCLYQLLLRFPNLVFAELLFLTRIFITFFILIFTVTRWFCRLKTIVILNSKRKWLSISKIYWEVSLALYASNFFCYFSPRNNDQSCPNFIYEMKSISLTLSQYCPSFVCSVPKKDWTYRWTGYKHNMSSQ